MRARLLICLFAAWCFATPVRAQDSGARVSGFFAGAFAHDQTNIETGGAIGYRFTPRIGFDLEVLTIPDLNFEGTDSSGHAVAFLSKLVTELPTPGRWLVPYIEGGGGVANLSESPLLRSGLLPRSPDGRRRDAPASRADVDRIQARRNDTALALTVGGGVDFQLWRGFAIGPTLSYRRLFGNLEDQDFTRIGARASYRF
jgi:opacity protein-like surface antigen